MILCAKMFSDDVGALFSLPKKDVGASGKVGEAVKELPIPMQSPVIWNYEFLIECRAFGQSRRLRKNEPTLLKMIICTE